MIHLLFLISYAIFFIFDFLHDHSSGATFEHIWQEMLMFGLTIIGIVAQSIKIRNQKKKLSEIKTELELAKIKNHDWKQKTESAAAQIRQMIDDQFGLWHLSQSEKEVALLLIKGFSMKEIAEIRSTHEKTVRQQSVNIYKKSSLSGRQQLAAFFLEDILTESP